MKKREKESLTAVRIGLFVNVVLALAKTAGGIVGHSPALLADGINSTSDVAYYVVVAIFLRMAGKPPDTEHPYGHRQLETIAALIVGAFIVTTSIAVFWNSVNSLYDITVGTAASPNGSLLTLIIAITTILIKVIITQYTQRTGRLTQNAAILALARDHRNDVFAATAAALGIGLGLMGYSWVDPLAGALVAFFILHTGISILRESSDDLMDTIPGKTLAQRITTLVQTVPGIVQIEEIHAHRFGPYLVINITIGVDGHISVADGDRIACQAEDRLYAELELLRRVYVHYHPASSRNKHISLMVQ